MKPNISKIRRILPYSLPLSIALLAMGWMMAPRSGEEATLNPPSPSAADSGSVHKSSTLAAERERIRELVNAQEKEDEAPRNPHVVELLSQFRKSDRTLSPAVAWEITKIQKGKAGAIRFAGMEFKGIVDSKVDSAGVMLLGMKLENDLGRFQMSLRPDNRILAHVLFNGESHALLIKGFPQDGTWQVKKSTVAEIMCARPGATYPLTREHGLSRPEGSKPLPKPNIPSAFARVPLLSSDPESTFVYYIDFDGESVTSPFWLDGETINALPSGFATDEEAMTRIWQRVAEDFIAFDLNVTTNRQIYDATPPERRVMGVVTPTDDVFPGIYGVAILSSFGQEVPYWVIDTEFAGDDAFHAETTSHEGGHTVGLLHDGNSFQEYYPGQGTGETSWAPIMGDYTQDFLQERLDEELTTWSNGDYQDANNQEDDFAIISSENGFGYRNDDKGNTQATASTLIASGGVIADSGVIGQNTDQDWFSFTTSGGVTEITVKATDVESPAAPQRGSNLAVDLELYNAAGTLVTSAKPTATLDATLSSDLPEGNYFLKVEGGGRGTPATGFSKYGSVGQYAIIGTIPQVNLLTVAPAASEFKDSGGSGTFTVTTKDAWSWASNATWVTSAEAVNQRGNQDFTFTVSPNTTRASRTATITITGNGASGIHTITQEAADDHGDTIGTATLVEQVSTTDGEFEEAGDFDVFRIDVKGFGTLTVKTTGSTNTFGELLDFFGTRLASNDDALAPNFQISRSLGTGTYFVRVRHTRSTGLGQYKLVSSFKSGPVVFITPESKVLAAPGGPADFKVTCNTTWTWSSNASWIRTAEPAQQRDGQIFSYVVRPNETGNVRTAKIFIRSEAGTVTHTVTQNPRQADDHGNSTAQATRFPTNSSIDGKLEAENDIDVFRMNFATSGELDLRTIGFTDTVGDLLDEEGNLVASNDDSDGENFAIVTSIPAGVYYVKVRTFAGNALGSYRLVNQFTPSSLIELTYKPTDGGGIRGPVRQTVKLGANGREVTAVATRGYAFVRWSDGKKESRRVDLNVRTHVNVVAEFVRTLEVGFTSGRELADNQIPPVDLGAVQGNESKTVKFVVRNNSKKKLTGLKAVATGPDATAWATTGLPPVLQPGQSARLSVTLASKVEGSKLGIITISAKDAPSSAFRIQVMGVVTDKTSLARAASLDLKGSLLSSPLALPSKTASSGKSSNGTGEIWLAVSPDGLLRYRFQQAKGAKGDPALQISTNGESWTEASVISILKISSGKKTDEYEALIDPPDDGGLVWVISQNPPTEKKK